MSLNDLMLAFIADYPNANLMIRYDSLRGACRWTATAYIWRCDSETPADAISDLCVTLATNTITTLPALGAGWGWALVVPSQSWMPYTHREIANMRAGEHPPKLGPPPSHSIVYDGTAERLYVPDRLIRWVPEDDGSVRCERDPVLNPAPSEPLIDPTRNFRCVVEPVFDETEQA